MSPLAAIRTWRDACPFDVMGRSLPVVQQTHSLVETLKKAGGTLKDAGIPFMLGGGLACWARGHKESEHDVDLFVRPEDAERAGEVLAAAGMRIESPPEGWLLKAIDEGVTVDLIFRPSTGPVDEEMFARADEIEVVAMPMDVASVSDVLVTKLLALSEQDPNFRDVLSIARSLREQIDWDFIRERTADSPFARAFLTLAEGLHLVDARPAASRGATSAQAARR
jgi:predicted nucleotidyltransferase